MKYTAWILIFLLSVFINCSTKNRGGETPSEYIPSVELCEDKNSTFTYNDIISGEKNFIDQHNRNVIGYSDSTWWIKLTFKEMTIPDGEYIIIYHQAWSKTVDVYIPSPGGYLFYSAGNEKGFNARPLRDRNYAFPVTVNNGNPVIYFKLRSNYELVSDFKLLKKENFLERKSVVELFYVVLMAFLIYNLILFFLVRGKEYFYYCAYLLTYLVFLLAFDGSGFMYFWRNSPRWNDFAITGMLLLYSIWIILFFIEFTGVRYIYKRLTIFLKAFIVPLITLIILKIIFPEQHVILWAIPFLQVITITLLSISIYMAVKGSRVAAYFFISFFILFLFSLANSIMTLGFIDNRILIYLGLHAGIVICAVTSSLGMADKINTMRIHQAESERTVKEQNTKLARTNEELDATNQELLAAMEELEATNEELQAIMEELQNSNQLLWDSEQRLSGIFRYAPIGISLFDLKGNITQVNEYALNMLGYTREEILGKSFQSLTHPDDYSKGRDFFNQLISGKIDTYRYDKRYIRKDGSEWWADVSTSALKSETNDITAMIGVAIDLDEKIAAQMEHEWIQNQLWQAQKLEAVGTLAGGIAHDFNNILTAILGYTDLAISGIRDGENVEDSLRQVKSASVRAKDLVRQILTLSRSGDNVKALHRIAPIIEDALGLIRVGTPSTVRTVFTDDSGEKAVLCDQTQIHQVILNLCTNANYAMKDGGGELVISAGSAVIDDASAALHKVPAGEYLVITVSDTGTGMNRDILERIFDPFFTTKAPGIGTGLGLSVARGIILDHGGFIMAESEEGRGTKFSIYLPVYSGTEPEEQKEKVSFDIPGGVESLLIVDDEHVIAEMIRLLFQKLGYNIKTAPGGNEAYEIFKASPEGFDLVITDQVMPGMTGLELTREIKKIRPEIPVILCTGYSDIADPINAKEIGVTEFLSKPVMTEELAAAIRRVLDNRK